MNQYWTILECDGLVIVHRCRAHNGHLGAAERSVIIKLPALDREKASVEEVELKKTKTDGVALPYKLLTLLPLLPLLKQCSGLCASIYCYMVRSLWYTAYSTWRERWMD